LQNAGLSVARIWIRPGPFAAWCEETSPQTSGAPDLASEAARNLGAAGKMPSVALQICITTDGAEENATFLPKLYANDDVENL
jgi:hypothetical protein